MLFRSNEIKLEFANWFHVLGLKTESGDCLEDELAFLECQQAVIVSIVLAEYNVKFFAGFKLPKVTGMIADRLGDGVVLHQMGPAHVWVKVNPDIAGGDVGVEIELRQFEQVVGILKAQIQPLGRVVAYFCVGSLFIAVVPLADLDRKSVV